LVINGENYFTLKEIGEAAGRSPQTIRRWAREGKVPTPKKIESSGRLVFGEDDRKEIIAFATRITPF
jgi:predicted site-specific integrase-resolvase